MQTAASPAFRRFFAALMAGGVSAPPFAVLNDRLFAAGFSMSMTVGEKVLACVIRRPELVISRGLNSSEASVSSRESSSSEPRLRFFLRAMWPRRPAALLPALLPLGLPPRFTLVVPRVDGVAGLSVDASLFRGLPPRSMAEAFLLPRGRPPLFLGFTTGTSIRTPAAVAASSVMPFSPSSIFTIGLRPPLPLRPPVFTPPLFNLVTGVGVGAAARF